MTTLRLGIAIPNYGPLATPEALCRLASHAEALGADDCWVSDHLVAPVGVRSVYPYDRHPHPRPGDMGVIEEFYEPVTTLAVLAGRTRRIGLGVSAYVMPYRHPIVTAKQIATLDRLSGGRVTLALGVGWLREEFAALGVPFDRRGRRSEEYLAVCRTLWAGGEAHYDGEFVRLPPVRTGPRPVQSPHPPIWIAGNSSAALARAARIGDGWHAIDLTPAAIADPVRRLHARARAAGRDPATITISLRATVTPGGPPDRPLAGDVDAIRHARDAYLRAGVHHLLANVRGVTTLDAALDRMDTIVTALIGDRA